MSSLQNAEYEGWITKQGGSWKSWKRRWLVLSGNSLFYFKTRKDQDITGVITLNPQSSIRRDDKNKKSKYCFAVVNADEAKGRVFVMYPDSEKEMNEWMKNLNNAIKSKGGGGGGAGAGAAKPAGFSEPAQVSTQATNIPAAGQPDRQETSSDQLEGVRARLDAAKNAVPWLHVEESKILEFWQIWGESIPPQDEITEGSIIFDVAVSADMEKLSWRCSGPQGIFIQKMVDFFWNVGAPETEIDRLNDVGALINPVQIGSWIDMSAKGGMDGGWFFPVDVPLKFALEACDAGDSADKVANWAEHNQVQCTSVGRDMGAAPPRQTELKFLIGSSNIEEQLEKVYSAYEEFGIPLSDDVLPLINQHWQDINPLTLSIITSSEGFVRLGLIVPHPTPAAVEALCPLVGANTRLLSEFQQCLGVDGPEYVEFQHLVPGFGYGVYKEGFDIVFHYKVGEETGKQAG